MAKAKKLKSGNWRCLVYDYTDENGKRHYESFTAETKKEAEYLAAEFALRKKEEKIESITIEVAITRYCAVKENVLSPSTIREYERMKNTCFTEINSISIKKINKEAVQVWVNALSANHSPKTVKNAYGLLSAVLDMYASDKRIKVTLPQARKPELYVPSDQDVQAVLSYFRRKNDTEMEKAIMLAAFGPLRRSEICGLCAEDIKGNLVIVRRAEVMDRNNQFVTKTTKTYSSQRVVKFPDFVIDKISVNSGRVVALSPTQISKRFSYALKKLEVPHFRFHDLRHYTASIMHAIGIPDQYILGRGGWSSEQGLNIYKNRVNAEETKFTDIILRHFEDMQHEMQHENKKPL